VRLTVFALLLMSCAAALAQAPAPAAPETLDHETVYSDAEIERDQSISRETVGTVLDPVSTVDDQYARWKQPVCFNVYGLSATAKYVVERRLKEIAHQVGAPVDRRDPCPPTVTIVFTPDPVATLESVAKVRPFLVPGLNFIRSRVRQSQPIQAWYNTLVTNDKGTKILEYDGYTDDPVWSSSASISRLQTGLTTEMASVLMTVDTNAIMGMSLGTLADHFALLSLAQARALRGCREIETIANLMKKDCAAGLQPAAITNNDLALLTGLYKTPDDFTGRLQRQRIIGNMRKSLEAQAKQ
jgi:hypothetical protein